MRLWTTWNEPNHPSFLLPQWERVGGRWEPSSPHLYREMHNEAYASIKRINSQNQVLLGGTAALGSSARGPTRGIPPLRFLRELACVDRRGRPLERPECDGFQPLQADGYAHHPYSLYDSPDASSPNPDDVMLGDLDRLSTELERLHSAGRITTRLPVFVTEYGYETNPPDVIRGVSLRQQARYHGLATFLAWKRADVSLFAQFLLNDVAPPKGRERADRGVAGLADGALLQRRPAEAGGSGVQAAVLGGEAVTARRRLRGALRPGAAEGGPSADRGRGAGTR